MDNHPFWRTAKTHVLGQLLILLSCDAGKFKEDSNSHKCFLLTAAFPSGHDFHSFTFAQVEPRSIRHRGMLLLKRVR